MSILEKFNEGRLPAKRILRRGGRDRYAIIHFSLNTFTDKEWGYGDESPELFRPSEFDADQIVRSCRDGGLTGLILVCKHHDGFCLWPTKTTGHNISKSPFRGGKGDIVREISDSCRKFGLDMGFYVSPWDRNHPEYGKPGYLAVYREQLREIYTNYGPAFEAWFDGANGGDGFYGGARETRKIDRVRYYDWPNTWQIVRDLQPDAAIFSDIGPDLRWVGNEFGFAGEDSFGCYTPHADSGDEPAPGCVKYPEGVDGHADGKFYIPPECDVPLRPGWFYHKSDDNSLRTVKQLVKIYLRSCGCGGFLNLGISPDRRGLVHENDVRRLTEFNSAVESLFAEPVLRGILAFRNGEAFVNFGKTVHFNLLELAEDLTEGELVTGWRVDAHRGGGTWETVFSGKAVGLRRLKAAAESVECDGLRITLTSCRAPVETLRIGCYSAPAELLDGKEKQFDARSRSDYRRLADSSGVHGEEMVLDAGGASVSGFVLTPDPALPSGTPDRYVFEVLSKDGWLTAAEGEFSNLRANPIPQVVEFSPVPAEKIRFRASRMLIPGDSLAFAEFGILVK